MAVAKIKKCGTCKLKLASKFFWKNASRKDGLATQCKECFYKNKTKWGSSIQCDSCPCIFKLGHRNIARRKTHKCPPCFKIWNGEQIRKRNAERLRDDSPSTYRIRALFHYGKSCNRCSWSVIEGVLEVHHTDRNRDNGAIENLEVLCPNCHKVEHFKMKDGPYRIPPVPKPKKQTIIAA